MRLVFLIVLSLFSSACHDGGSSHRSSYVISKSSEAVLEERAASTEELSD